MSTINLHNVDNILKRLLYALKFDSYQQLADYLEVDNKVISAWKARNSKKAIAVISSKCRHLDLNWVLTGEGEHLEKQGDRGAGEVKGEQPAYFKTLDERDILFEDLKKETTDLSKSEFYQIMSKIHEVIDELKKKKSGGQLPPE